jgi:response regulator RpfG family c-di-GMP phosphodiesterase
MREQIENPDYKLNVLIELGKILVHEHRLDNVLMNMADFAREILSADRCSIFIHDAKRNELWTKIAHGVDEIRIPADKGIAGYAALSKDIQIVVDAYNDFRFNPEIDRVTGYFTKTVLAVPLLNSQDETIGVFQALNKKSGLFTNMDAELLLLISNNTSYALENALLYEKLRDTQTKIVDKLSSAAEFKDNETSAHTKRVGLYSALLAEGYGMRKRDIEIIKLASPMHDAGKIGISDDILKKPSKLDIQEFEDMKKHSLIGYELLYDDDSEILKAAAIIAKDHHEKYNGSGYPYGLESDEISIHGRIVAITDVFDALTSKRPYKEAWEFDKAIDFIKSNRGTHFDPILVDLFLRDIIKVKNIYNELKD